MPAERYFLEETFKLQDVVVLKQTEFHHLSRVMRTKIGELIELINGKGSLALAKVSELKKDQAHLKIVQLFEEPSPPPRLILAQALPKPNRLEFILEKGTELGVDLFWLFPGEHSLKKEYFPSQIERGKAITIAAIKQCGRLILPQIILKPPLRKWQKKENLPFFFGDLRPEAPLFENAWKESSSSSYPVIFLTGPESGLSDAEVDFLKEYGAKGVRLHSNILRTDTASLMALSLLSHWMTTPL